MIKNLPIGIDDFKETNSSYYVDKTLFIKTIVDNFIGKSILVTRPRRFGKSLMASMLEYYFSILLNEKEIFENKMILKEGIKYVCEMNQYPVIRLDMKNIVSNDESVLFNDLIDLISNIYARFSHITNSDKLSLIEKEEFNKILTKESTNIYDYTTSILKLSSLLHKYYDKKVIIIVDEYDTPIEIAYQNGKYDKVIMFFNKFYSSFLKGNSNLHFAFITGVLEIAKESIFSDLNNLNVYSVLDEELIEYFGFTEKEVEDLFLYYNIPYNKEIISLWYGGYGNNKLKIYNPWSILNYINKERYLPYWVNSGSNDTVSTLINSINNSIDYLNEIINNRNQIVSFNNAISYKDIKNNYSSLLSYLVQSGYLVAEPIDKSNNYIIRIPNKEIEDAFVKEIIGRNIDTKTISLCDKLRNALLECDTDKISTIFKEYIVSSFSYYDLNSEKEYQIMLTGILSVLFSDFVVKSEVINSRGRCDIMITPKANKDLGFIFELKKHKGIMSKNKLNESSLQAINQVKEKEYYSELLRNDIKKIYIYGISFDDRNNSVNLAKIDK